MERVGVEREAEDSVAGARAVAEMVEVEMVEVARAEVGSGAGALAEVAREAEKAAGWVEGLAEDLAAEAMAGAGSVAEACPKEKRKHEKNGKRKGVW